jgi:PhnB protein
MTISTHLGFNGQCQEAFKFYERVLGGNIQFSMTYGDSPMAGQVPPEWRDKIIHTTLVVGDQTLSGADAPPPHYQKPQGFSVAVEVKDPSKADRIFTQLGEGGTVQMAIQETFWAQRFGMLVDRFHIPWMITCSKPQP